MIPADRKWYRDLAVAEILAETRRVRTRMKHRWLVGLLLLVALALGACTPGEGGDGARSTPAPADGYDGY